MPHIIDVSYQEIHDMCTDISKRVAAPDCIVALSRGGLIPGVILSHMLSVPLVPVCYSSKRGAGDNKDHDNVLPNIEYDTILIVDDICDTSKTLSEVVSWYKSLGKQIQTAVLHYKIRTDPASYIPDFAGCTLPENSGWVVYPFEQGDDNV